MPGPVGETPQQRVARLKAAAAKAKSAQVSQFDKWVLVGRRWADRAHRFTAFTLIGVTGTLCMEIDFEGWSSTELVQNL